MCHIASRFSTIRPRINPPVPTTTAATTTAPSTTPALTSFTASATTFTCSAVPVSTVAPQQLTLTWTTQNATGVTLAIDGPGKYADYGPNGNVTLPAHCDGSSHTYTLTPFNGSTQGPPKTITTTSTKV